jgi:glycerol-3-phosphate cytidylyltransferase
MLVLTYGTFDLFHYGHIRLLQRARAMGTSLAVGLSTDEFNALKGKKAVMSYEERKSLLLSCRAVDLVFAENTWEQKADDIVNYRAGVLVMGDDWQGKFDHFGHLCKVAYLERTPIISSTMLREGLKDYDPTVATSLRMHKG